MDSREVRAGIQQAEQNKFGLGLFSIEAAVIGGVAGWAAGSFLVGVAAFVGLVAMSSIIAKHEEYAQYYAIVFGIAVGIMCGWWASRMGAEDGTSMGVAMLVGVVSVGANIAAMRAMRDLNHNNHR